MMFRDIFLLVALLPVTSLNQLSNYLTLCKYDDPKLNECVRKSIEDLLRSSAGGMKEFGIPTVDPLPIPKMTIDQGLGAVGIVIQFNDAKLNGISRVKVHSARVSPDEFTLDATGTCDFVSIVGEYDVKGRILLLPISGHGQSNISLVNNDLTLHLKGEPTRRKGKTHMRLTQFEIVITPKEGSIQLENLFNGNKQLGDTMNKFLNENYLEVMKELGPSINEAISVLIGGLGQRIYDKIPYAELFPKS